MKHPVLISVDTEFTTGDLAHGQMMQLGMVDAATGQVAGFILPVTADARTNDWVKENLGDLLRASLMQALNSNHLPPVHIGERKVSGALMGIAGSAQNWVYSRRKEAFFRHHEAPPEGTPIDPTALDEFPAVMIHYCGGYDFGFIDRLFNQCGMVNPFHYEAIDIASLAMALGFGWDATAKDIEEYLDMEPVEDSERHDAVFDAKRQLEVYTRLTQHFAKL